MILRKCLPLILAVAPFFASAQKLTCTTHGRTNEILESSPEKRALIEQLNREAELYTAEHYGERAGGLKVIPTVIHVIHNNGAENISKTSILNIMESVNTELRGLNNTSSVSADFQGLIADTQFELRLAKIDDNGNCTDGITRTVYLTGALVASNEWHSPQQSPSTMQRLTPSKKRHAYELFTTTSDT